MENTEVKIEGIVYSIYKKIPLSNVNITLKVEGEEYKVKSREDGNFSMNVNLPIKIINEIKYINSSIQPTLNFNLENYKEKFVKIYRKDNSLKLYNIVILRESNKELINDITKNNIVNDFIVDFKKFIKKDFKQALRDFILNKINEIYNKFYPILLNLLYEFSITNIQEALKGNYTSKCPDKSKYSSIIKKRNNLVKGLNILYKSVDSILKALTVFTGLLEGFKVIKSILLNLPIPIVIGTPPGPQGGVIYSKTMGDINKNTQNLNKIESLIKEYENLSIPILVSLMLLKSALGRILSMVQILDKNIENCIESSDLTPLDIELLEILKEEIKENNIINEYNGFIFEIGVEEKNDIKIQRKFAIAKNKQGVTLLKGEPSYSSDEKILIDELIFYIKNNGLKAY